MNAYRHAPVVCLSTEPPFASLPKSLPEARLRERRFDVQRKAHLHLLEGYVARAYMIEPAEIYLATRGRADVAEARQLVMYLAHVEIGLTIAQVAERYKRDRSTASYACREVEDRREDPFFDGLVNHIEELISLRRDPFLQGQRAPEIVLVTPLPKPTTANPANSN
ncbi:hypothetical protein J0X15_08375 [Roseibium sp. CAU 1637]|uniref:Chromosomal replication initiator DnaA C-terminal domain-containing protein n=1 Tax=Roseibium limicola TaxID=2816037 RepID=A0A939J9B9_9HYPH|nr:helix-turn-helix domain-containing protein [Roseibium limicola]MBO0345233.1 hypothetical protein [Roseibium limicola]